MSHLFCPAWLPRLALALAGCAAGATASSQSLPHVELVELNPQTWDGYAPRGKEVDCIYGDWVLQNPWIRAVVAQPTSSRNANMTVRAVGGCLIDLSCRQHGPESDQLSAFYPAGDGLADGATMLVHGFDAMPDSAQHGMAYRVSESLELLLKGIVRPGRPAVTVVYTLGSQDQAVLVKTIYSNPHNEAVEVVLADTLRADGEFRFHAHPQRNLFVAEDEYWRQAYAIEPVDAVLRPDPRSVQRKRPVLNYEVDGKTRFVLNPRESISFSRRIRPGPDSLMLLNDRTLSAAEEESSELVHGWIVVRDSAGPIFDAKVEVLTGEDAFYAQARTPPEGAATGDDLGAAYLIVPPGDATWKVRVTAAGRPPAVLPLKFDNQRMIVELPRPGSVTVTVTEGNEQPIPAKIAFHGLNGTPDPDFGPDSAIHGVRNLHYTHDGTARCLLVPGEYDVVVSHGPEFDAVVRRISVDDDGTTDVTARLERTVDTSGWLSADFHSHSTPSGDNTSNQRGRVLNLLAEHIEFGPCTEHNRIDTYVPHLEHFEATDRMATCTGMELTGRPLPVNHQNAFPLKHHPRLQDGGGPVTDENPVTQIERLALWDEASDKLVQTDHPNIPLILNDRDYDGVADGGFERMFGFMDVIEVHPPEKIFSNPGSRPATHRDRGNVAFHWLQLLNLGYRIPGVVNTDAHWNFHGSGWLRNYIRSPVDEPAKADIMDLVHASERGQMVLTNGPFLEVRATAGEGDAASRSEVGGDLAAADGAVRLAIRVQCANWLDVNRVQVFVNGRPSPDHNFTRRTHPELFSDATVRFETDCLLELERDAHLIVATIGEGLELGRVMGPRAGRMPPAALSNPIFVDVDGGGFAANGDLMGVPLVPPASHEEEGTPAR